MTRLDRVLKSRRLVNSLRLLDRALLANFRFLRPYARTVVVTLRPMP